MRFRELIFQYLGGLDEVDRVVVMLFDTCSDGEYVGIEDDVLRRETDFVHQNTVRSPANGDLSFNSIGLAFFVESHHDHCGAVSAYCFSLLSERFFALLERN